MMQKIKYPLQKDWKKILQRPSVDNAALMCTVKTILDDVKEKGDSAVSKYTNQFDGILLNSIVVSKQEMQEGNQIPETLKLAISQAAENIRIFHQKQLQPVAVIETMPGIECSRKSVAIEKVGLYIPGGTAPLFSTLLMLGIPAAIAGCKEIIICTPADKNGKIHPAILYTASLLGLNRIYKIGGVQAIAAMAYGTESVAQVYKIFGPGNQYVTAAKQLIREQGIAIDMPAGPSELCVLADETADADFIAADLLSQAEHGKDSQVLLIITSETLAGQVLESINSMVLKLSRNEIAIAALENSKVIIVKNIAEGIDLVNEYAPEHLIISCKNEDAVADKIINAGSVFIGNYSPESVGDYASGTNHVLPTNGFAKAYSGVSVESFVKKITFQKLSYQGLQSISKTVIAMAQAEGLDAHANAVSIRLKK
jgi:histidinol dehydrogenase